MAINAMNRKNIPKFLRKNPVNPPTWLYPKSVPSMLWYPRKNIPRIMVNKNIIPIMFPLLFMC